MATSSKVEWNLEKLREHAVTAIDDRIEAKQVEVDSHSDEKTMEQRVAEWRAQQEERISELFRRLGGDELSNEELARFEIEPMPKRDAYAHHRAERELQALRARRGKILAKSGALVTDDQGNVSLTKTQLAEFFDL